MSNKVRDVTREYQLAEQAAADFNPGLLPDLEVLVKAAFVHGYAAALIGRDGMMKPMKCRLECGNCGLGFLVTYDTSVPARILQLDCKCGHSTKIKSLPPSPAESPHPA